MHESFDHSNGPVLPSERQFGLVFAVVFGALGGLRAWRAQGDGLFWLGLAALFAGLACFYPAPLRRLNIWWARFGALLQRLVTPVLMGLIFFGALVPIGMLMRLLGKDPLRLRRDPQAASFWCPCTDDTVRRGAMKDQF